MEKAFIGMEHQVFEGAAGAALWWRSPKMNSSSSRNWRPGDQCTITSSSLSELRSITSCNMFGACWLSSGNWPQNVESWDSSSFVFSGIAAYKECNDGETVTRSGESNWNKTYSLKNILDFVNKAKALRWSALSSSSTLPRDLTLLNQVQGNKSTTLNLSTIQSLVP